MQKLRSVNNLKKLVGSKHTNYEDNNMNQRPKKIMLNAYSNVDKIVNYINSNYDLRENETLVGHFTNIKYNKKMDDLTKVLVNKNKVGIAESSPSPKPAKKNRRQFHNEK
jgi:hypothetical protein